MTESSSELCFVAEDRPLKEFPRFLAAASAANLGDGMSYAIIPLLAVRATSSEFLISVVSFSRTLPILLFTLFVGVIADNHSKSAMMKLANAVRCAGFVSLGLLIAMGWFNIYALIGLAFFLGFFETMYDTTAESVTPELVPKSELDRANGRLATAEHIANNCLGAPIGSALAALGLPYAVVGNGLSYLISIAAFWPIKTKRNALKPVGIGSFNQIRDGLSFVRGERQLLALIAMSAIWNFVVAGINAMLAPLVLKKIGAPEWVFGLVLLMFAGGIPAGLFLEKIVKKLGRMPTILIAYALYCVAVPLIPTGLNLYVVCAMIAIIGFTSVIFGSAWRTYRQMITPPLLLGRVNSICRLITLGVMPLGAIFAGVVAELAGVVRLYHILGGVSLLGLITGLVNFWPKRPAL